MSFTHHVLGLYRECLQAGVEVELKLWFREGIEYFNFSKLQAPWSQSLRTRRRRRKRIKRRTCENTNHNVTAPLEERFMRAPQSEERSMSVPQSEERCMRLPQSDESSVKSPQSEESCMRAPQSEEKSLRAP